MRTYCIFGVLSAGIQHCIKKLLRLTKLLNILHEIKDTMHYQHGCKELPAAYRLRETPRGQDLIKVSSAKV